MESDEIMERDKSMRLEEVFNEKYAKEALDALLQSKIVTILKGLGITNVTEG